MNDARIRDLVVGDRVVNPGTGVTVEILSIAPSVEQVLPGGDILPAWPGGVDITHRNVQSGHVQSDRAGLNEPVIRAVTSSLT